MTAPSAGYELREHTADIALYVWGSTPETLFAAAAEGFYAALGHLKPAEPPGHERIDIRLDAPDQADLLGDFLAELLYLFDVRRARLAGLKLVALTDSRLHAQGRLEPLDMVRCEFDREIKAVTRHNLGIDAHPGRLETTIILDI
jgi:SHS2 domain-containing protein